MPLRDHIKHFKQPYPFGCIYYAAQSCVSEDVLTGQHLEDAGIWNCHRYLRRLGYELIPMYYSNIKTCEMEDWKSFLPNEEGFHTHLLVSCSSLKYGPDVSHTVSVLAHNDIVTVSDPGLDGLKNYSIGEFLFSPYAKATLIFQILDNTDETFPVISVREAPHLADFDWDAYEQC